MCQQPVTAEQEAHIAASPRKLSLQPSFRSSSEIPSSYCLPTGSTQGEGKEPQSPDLVLPGCKQALELGMHQWIPAVGWGLGPDYKAKATLFTGLLTPIPAAKWTLSGAPSLWDSILILSAGRDSHLRRSTRNDWNHFAFLLRPNKPIQELDIPSVLGKTSQCSVAESGKWESAFLTFSFWS